MPVQLYVYFINNKGAGRGQGAVDIHTQYKQSVIFTNFSVDPLIFHNPA
ncbi:uncharacterized protein METZ01_LOCUS66093 [marine metagenome]|uniref:Uncharacterized protein n=1 Tax=marine metagenome TaxID=408172 RepID=A0A381TBY1_9ZZZZ